MTNHNKVMTTYAGLMVLVCLVGMFVWNWLMFFVFLMLWLLLTPDRIMNFYDKLWPEKADKIYKKESTNPPRKIIPDAFKRKRIVSK